MRNRRFTGSKRALGMSMVAVLILIALIASQDNWSSLPWASDGETSEGISAPQAESLIPEVFPGIGPNPLPSSSLKPSFNDGFGQPNSDSQYPGGPSGEPNGNPGFSRMNFECTGSFNVLKVDGDIIISINLSAPPDIEFVWARVTSPSGSTAGEIPMRKGQGFIEVPLPFLASLKEKVNVEFFSTPNFSSDDLVCSAD